MVQEFLASYCGTASKVKKSLEDQCLVKLLMGLNDSYDEAFSLFVYCSCFNH